MKKVLFVAFLSVLLLVSCATSGTGNKPAYDPYEGLIVNTTTGSVYDTFEAALGDLNDGDTIVLHTDVALAGPTDIKVGLTLDLNGYTITCPECRDSNKAALNFPAAIGSHIKHVEIKNGTISGAFLTRNSSGVVRFVYVDDAVLTNLNVISTANDSSVLMSGSVYNAYSNVTINNTKENRIVGRVITYMNDSNLGKDGAQSPTTTINGGTFAADPTSSDNDIFTLSNEKGNVTVIVNDAYVESGSIDNMSGEALKEVSNFKAYGGSFAFVLKKGYIGDGKTGSNVDGMFVVK